MPDRHECFGNRCGGDHVYSRRNEKRMSFMRGAVLRVAAPGDERHDFVAELEPRRIFADSDDVAGNFEAWNIAGAGRRWIRSKALHNVSAVYSRCCDLYQNFIRVRRRHGPLVEDKYLRPAGSADIDSGHFCGQHSRDLSPKSMSSLRAVSSVRRRTSLAEDFDFRPSGLAALEKGS